MPEAGGQRLLTVRQAAKVLGVSRSEMERLAAAGELMPLSVRGRAYYVRASVEQFADTPERPWQEWDAPETLPEIAAPRNGGGVYFIQGAERVKIGFSRQVARRLVTLRNLSPVPLRLVGWLAGDPCLERVIHQHFRHQRESGEWFRLTEDVARAIDYLNCHPEVREAARPFRASELPAAIGWLLYTLEELRAPG